MQNIRDKIYLGDGAYAGHDGYQLWLGANNHRNMTVALEPNVMLNLMMYIHRKFPHVSQEFLNSIPKSKRE